MASTKIDEEEDDAQINPMMIQAKRRRKAFDDEIMIFSSREFRFEKFCMFLFS